MSLDRSEFLKLGAAGALAAFAGGGAATAAAQGPAPAPEGDDIGYVQWGATAELLSVAYWRQAIASEHFTDRAKRRLRAARDADAAHLRRLNAVLGEDAPSDDDFEIELPASAFRSRERILAFGQEVEQRVTGVYLDAVNRVVNPETRLLLGRLLIADTQHIALLRTLANEVVLDGGLRSPIRVETAGEWIDRYLVSPSFPTE